MTYPKIETLYERDEKFKIVPGLLKRPILGSIGSWLVTEKVDGTNMRVGLDEVGESVWVAGRTDDAQIHPGLLRHMNETFTVDALRSVTQGEDTVLTLYGEGYGAKIQKGGGDYRADQGFILFDVKAESLTDNRSWWLKHEDVVTIGNQLGIPMVPVLGEMSLPEIVELVEQGFDSKCCTNPRRAEGIVAKTIEPLYDNRGQRLIIKLKTKDFA